MQIKCNCIQVAEYLSSTPGNSLNPSPNQTPGSHGVPGVIHLSPHHISSRSAPTPHRRPSTGPYSPKRRPSATTYSPCSRASNGARRPSGGPFSPSCSSATTSPSEYAPSEVSLINYQSFIYFVRGQFYIQLVLHILRQRLVLYATSPSFTPSEVSLINSQSFIYSAKGQFYILLVLDILCQWLVLYTIVNDRSLCGATICDSATCIPATSDPATSYPAITRS